DRRNPFEEFSEEQFRRRFRFSKESAFALAEVLRPNQQRVTLQVLNILRFHATGAFHNVNADTVGVHETTVCRTVRAMSTPSNKRKFAEVSRYRHAWQVVLDFS
ncbi:hypothetical protein L9F63_005857, partial [Diploptera punctata]